MNKLIMVAATELLQERKEQIFTLRGQLISQEILIKTMSEYIKQVSDLTTGCRDGSDERALNRINELLRIEKKYKVSESTDKITDAVRGLNDIVNGIEAGN